MNVRKTEKLCETKKGRQLVHLFFRGGLASSCYLSTSTYSSSRGKNPISSQDMKPVSSPRSETEKLVHFNSPSSSSNSCEKPGNMRRVEHFSLTPESNRSRYVYYLAPNFKRCLDDKYKVAIQNNLSTEEVHNNRKSVNGLCQPETGAIICSSRFSPFLANQCNSEVIDPGVTEQVVNLISRLAENSPAMKREQVHLRRCYQHRLPLTVTQPLKQMTEYEFLIQKASDPYLKV